MREDLRRTFEDEPEEQHGLIGGGNYMRLRCRSWLSECFTWV